MPVCYTDSARTKRWYKDISPNEFRSGYTVLHREDGPAVEWDNGGKEWFLNGKRHRAAGPAIEYVHGLKEWWIDGIRHRDDGPAIEWYDGDKEWYLNGELHRKDGPAIERISGYKEWHYHGKFISCKDNEEFLRIVKLMVFL